MKHLSFSLFSLSIFALAAPLCAIAQPIANDSLTVRFEAYPRNGQHAAFSLQASKKAQTLLVFAQGAPKTGDFAVEFDATPTNSEAKFGLILHYLDNAHWTYIGCDQTTDIFGNAHWYAYQPGMTPKQRKEVAVDISKPYRNYRRHYRIECVGKSLTIYVDGEKITQRTLTMLDAPAGYIGFRVHDGADVAINNLSYTALKTPKATATRPAVTLASDQLEATLCKDYPAVVQYRMKASGEVLAGMRNTARQVTINGINYPSKSRIVESTTQRVVYHTSVPAAKVSFDTEFALETNVFTMRITDLVEAGPIGVKTLGFPNHDIVSVQNSTPGAMLSVAHNVSGDSFFPLLGRGVDTTALTASIAILNTAHTAVTLDNNSIYNARQFQYRTAPDGYTSIYNNEWMLRGVGDSLLPLPWMKVIFALDANEDGAIDWQDAAVELARRYPEPYGADAVRNSYASITMNFASGGQYPFLRQLDNIKKFSLATDGFGQIIEMKGYQSEGHDSAHPDYAGHYNTRAGGLRDLQLLTKHAKAYNTLIGVHINQSEAYPEARAYDSVIVTDLPGWAWLDQAYLINKEVDVALGRFNQRLDQLHQEVPELAFIYIDTYREHRALAHHTAQSFNRNGWAAWTEDPDIFYRESPWTHYTPDAKGAISRFVQHQFRDGYAVHPLLFGGYNRGAEIGFMGWQKGKDFNGVVERFFIQQLPYRYLMHFPLMRIDSVEARLDKGVISRLDESGQNVILRQGRVIKQGKIVFIPWNPITEEKIYHYNPDGGATTWNLPASWDQRDTVMLYLLSDQGRQKAVSLPVTAGPQGRQITIDALPKQGYVVYPQAAPMQQSIVWGEFGAIGNPGFDGPLGSPCCVNHEGMNRNWFAQTTTQAVRTGKTVQAVTTGTTTLKALPYGQDVLELKGEKSQVFQQVKLDANAHYTLSVWCLVSGKGTASLSIGGQSYSIGESTVRNFTDNTDRFNSNFQRIKVPYTHAGAEPATIRLTFVSAPGDSSYAYFDDVRIVSQKAAPSTAHAYFEDFEDIDEGWGPFIASKRSNYMTHLSERHEGYTSDVIDGQFSFKTWREGNGEVYRTSPSMIHLRPNETYQMQFDYKTTADSIYRVVVRSKDDDREVFTQPLDGEGLLQTQFTTGSADDYYIAVFKQEKRGGMTILVIDNFTIDGPFER